MANGGHQHGTPIDRQGLDAACQRLFDRSSRVVGWGSGSVFDYFHGLWPLRLDYLVDNDEVRWGTRRHGIDVVSPDRLAVEDPATTFVVIYSSAWPEIQGQLGTVGAFASLPASAVFADTAVRLRLGWADELAARTTVRSPQTGNAIVVQGPLVAGITPRVLRAMSAVYPHDLIVVSTWDDSDPALLDEVRTLADDVVSSPVPSPAGIQNRNCQIVSTRTGIRRAVERGAQTILKTRTDLAVLRHDVFGDARWWLERVGSDRAREAGLRGRLLVPSSFTRKYFLYHPSDLVMLGSASDLEAFWAAPLDPRTGHLLSPDWLDAPLSWVNMQGNPTESYLGLAFCRTIGRATAGTLRDSWAFLRDLFAVVDNDWLEILWYKNLALPDSALRTGIRQTVSQAAWLRLQRDGASTSDAPGAVDPETITLRMLTAAPG
jgi:hypothetical protein